MNIEIKITLLGSREPEVWRQIKLSPDTNFHQLHLILQAAFGWGNRHLYQFSEKGFGSLITINSPHDPEAVIKAKEVSVSSLLFNMYNQSMFNKKNAPTLSYIYDFGDSWEHEIAVIDFDRDGDGKNKLVAGAGACPPEDCGGIHGFEDIKACLKTGKVSQLTGEPWEPWLIESGYKNFDPKVFDEKAARQRLMMLG